MLELLFSKPICLHTVDSDYTLLRSLTGLTTLTFTLLTQDPDVTLLREDGLLRDTSDGLEYRIRGIHSLPDETEVSARIQLDDWESSAVTSFYRKNATAAGVLGEIMPQNWSLRCLGADSTQLEVNLEYGGTTLDIAQKVQELFGCALEFDNVSNVLILSFPQKASYSDTILTEGADLKSAPEYTGKSTELVTRIYPVGAENLTISSVNDGKDYVENHTYTPRVISKIWKDERYTIASHLMAAAQEMVDSLCTPEISWEVSIRDLYRRDPDRWAGHRAELGQKLRICWQGRTISAMLVQEEVHPSYPGRNRIWIGSTPPSMISAAGAIKRWFQVERDS